MYCNGRASVGLAGCSFISRSVGGAKCVNFQKILQKSYKIPLWSSIFVTYSWPNNKKILSLGISNEKMREDFALQPHLWISVAALKDKS
jgi:hypothetical protein